MVVAVAGVVTTAELIARRRRRRDRGHERRTTRCRPARSRARTARSRSAGTTRPSSPRHRLRAGGTTRRSGACRAPSRCQVGPAPTLRTVSVSVVPFTDSARPAALVHRQSGSVHRAVSVSRSLGCRRRRRDRGDVRHRRHRLRGRTDVDQKNVVPFAAMEPACVATTTAGDRERPARAVRRRERHRGRQRVAHHRGAGRRDCADVAHFDAPVREQPRRTCRRVLFTSTSGVPATGVGPRRGCRSA